VESIEILTLESFPVQIHVLARGILPDGCTEIDQINQRSDLESSIFWIEITTVRPTGAVCTAEAVPFEESIPLDVYGLSAGTYTVDVNGVKETFTLDVDNAPPQGGDGEAQPLVDLSIADLAKRLGVGPDEITVQSVEATEFPNASLGVLEPGKVYAQVITPGYIIRLAVNGTVYEYHGSGDYVVFAPTSSPPVYQEMNIPEAGLVFEVPAGWLRLEPEWAWAPDGANSLRLGVNWMDIQPPQEVEAAMLPTPSQVIHSEPVELGWGSGRRFTVEVYAPAAQGGDTRAPVQSVETHVLIVVSQGDTRRAFDFYASGQTAEQLAILEPSLQHMLDSAALQ
jgi:hypothetical protein